MISRNPQLQAQPKLMAEAKHLLSSVPMNSGIFNNYFSYLSYDVLFNEIDTILLSGSFHKCWKKSPHY